MYTLFILLTLATGETLIHAEFLTASESECKGAGSVEIRRLNSRSNKPTASFECEIFTDTSAMTGGDVQPVETIKRTAIGWRVATSADTEIARIVKAHPDITELIKEPHYSAWLKRLSPGDQERLAGETLIADLQLLDAGIVISKLNEYKRWRSGLLTGSRNLSSESTSSNFGVTVSKNFTMNSDRQQPANVPSRELIAEVQSLLYELNYYRGAVDGKFGPKTWRAIESAETDLGLDSRGIVTNKLRDALLFEANSEKTTASQQHINSTFERKYPSFSPIVERAQIELYRQGFYAGKIDGVLGPRTKQAIEAFQQARIIIPSSDFGDLGFNTRRSLRLE